MTADKTAPGAETPGEPPSLEALARRFLDLWQSHVAALAGDPETNLLLGRLIETQISTAEALLKASQAAAGWTAPDDRPSSAGAPGAEAPPASPAAGERDLAELARRLAACEEQLTRMEKKRA